MKTLLCPMIIAAAGLALGGCAATHLTHTAPGTSVELALAKKPELVQVPAPAAAAGAHAVSVNVPPVEPPMPVKDALKDKVADAYSRGVFCLQAEKDADAIQAFEEAVKLDPTFSEAWEDLAVLYEKIGDEKKALEAFRKAKKLARQ